jgi:hypothetical protein
MRFLGRLFTPWSVIGAVAFAGLMLVGTLAAAFLLRTPPAPKGPATAVINVIPAPTATPIMPTPAATNTPTSVPPPPPPMANLAVGAYVQIYGTEGDGLRVRAEPGLQGQFLFLALEAEVFVIKDGPREADGYIWWYLVSPSDAKNSGWAVANYLAVVQNP